MMGTHGALETMTQFIQFEINKHGHCGRADTVEDAVNSLSNFELLELIANRLDVTASRMLSMPAHLAEFRSLYIEQYGHPADLVSGSTGAVQTYQLLRGYMLGKGYSFAEIDAPEGLWPLTR